MNNFKITDNDVAVMKVGYHELQNILDIINQYEKQSRDALKFAKDHPKVFRDKDKIDELEINTRLIKYAASTIVDMLYFANEYEKVVYMMDNNEFTNKNEEGRL